MSKGAEARKPRWEGTATEAKAIAAAKAKETETMRERIAKTHRVPLKGMTEAEIDAAVEGLKDPSAAVGEAQEGSVADWANAVKKFEKKNK